MKLSTKTGLRRLVFSIAVTLSMFSTITAVADLTVVTNIDGRTYVVSTGEGPVNAPVMAGTVPSGVVATPNGLFAYISNFASDNVSVIDLTTGAVVAVIPVGAGPKGIAITPDGKFVYVANSTDSTISVIRTSDNSVVQTIPLTYAPNQLAIINGNLLFVTNTADDRVTIISLPSNTVTQVVPLGPGGTVGPIGIGADSSVETQTSVYVANSVDDTLSEISLATFTVVSTLPLGPPNGGVNAYGVAVVDGTAYVTRPSHNDVTVVRGGAVASVIDFSSYPSPSAIAASANGQEVYAITDPSVPGGIGQLVTVATSTNVITDHVDTATSSTVPTALALVPFLIDNLTGKQLKNDFALIYEYFNRLEWTIEPFSDVSGFRIFRDGVLIATLGAGAHSFDDHNRVPGKQTVYIVQPLNAAGDPVQGLTVTVN